ncbi:unnamed protein product [Lactuca saligna]|uniref:Uncharacterized protein n=1 Tax=Lactuca saligna TaxID=75948 RepID=A0AA35ZW00_LACSI|nr:unnamed protein product [Lactuca saligna]
MAFFKNHSKRKGVLSTIVWRSRLISPHRWLRLLEDLWLCLVIQLLTKTYIWVCSMLKFGYYISRYVYIGSANNDRKSLTQVKEVGIYLVSCPDIAKRSVEHYFVGHILYHLKKDTDPWMQLFKFKTSIKLSLFCSSRVENLWRGWWKLLLRKPRLKQRSRETTIKKTSSKLSKELENKEKAEKLLEELEKEETRQQFET